MKINNLHSHKTISTQIAYTLLAHAYLIVSVLHFGDRRDEDTNFRDGASKKLRNTHRKELYVK